MVFRTEQEYEFELCPYVHQTTNVVSPADQTRAVRIPDVLPSSIPDSVQFSMAAGEFCEVYGAQSGTMLPIVHFALIVCDVQRRLMLLRPAFSSIRRTTLSTMSK